MTIAAQTVEAVTRIARMMVIDDNQIDQRLYARVIQRSGIVGEILPHYTAASALDALRDPTQPQPDLILLDVNMPEMDGFGFLDAVEAEYGTEICPVIVMLTTSLNPADKQRAEESKLVRAFLNKPLTQALLEHIATLQQ